MKEITGGRVARLLNRRVVIAALFAVLFITNGFSQSAGFGSIAGVVEDPSGAAISNAKVAIDNAAKGIHREITSTSAGIFNLPALVPAAGYVVTINARGFATYRVEGINVTVGESVTLRPVLKIAVGNTEIVVNDRAPLVDQAKTDTSHSVDSTQIMELPINGRRVDVLVLLTPGVTSDGTFGLLSFRGNPGGNSFLTDGGDTTNSYYDENAGRTRSYNISQDAVQEFQVVTSNFAAEFGKASGGVVNTVTRSGNNAFHGSAYEFFRNRTLNATDITTVNKVFPKGINPPEWRHQAGVSLAGPIIKDKLFYFWNGELFRRNAPLVSSNIGASSVSGNNIFNNDGTIKTAADCVVGVVGAKGVTLPSGVKVDGPTAAQCTEARNYVISRALPQLISRTVDNNLLFGKVDYRPNSKDSLSFSFNYMDWRSPNGIQTQVSLTTGNAIGNNADSNVFDRTGRASWTRIVSPSKVNEFRFGMFKDRQFDPASKSLLPRFGATASPVALTVNSVSNLGYAQNYPRLNPSELLFEFADTFSMVSGKHNLKFGANLSHLEDYVNNLVAHYPLYNYNNLTQFALDFDGTTPTGKQAWFSYAQTTGNAIVDLNLWQVSAFAQDEWHLTPRLTVTPGLRYEYSTIPQPKKCNPAFPQTCKIPGTNLNFAPRLGLAFAINNKTSFRAGFGMFHNRYTTATIENLLVANGAYTQAYLFQAATAGTTSCLPSFPSLLPSTWTPPAGCSQTLTPNVLFADSHFRNPYSEQFETAIEREIAKDTSLTVSYVWSRGLHLPQTKDTNAGAPSGKFEYDTVDASGTTTTSTHLLNIYTANDYVNPNYKAEVNELQSAGNSYYNGLLVNLQKRYSTWLQGSIAYTWSHAIDYNQGGAPTFGNNFPTSFVNGYYKGEKGSSSIDQRHRVVINGVASPTFMNSNAWAARYIINGWQFSAVELMGSSQPLYPSYSGNISFPASAGFKAMRSGSLNGLGSTIRIPWESISALDTGRVLRTDARVTKALPVTERFKVALSFEAFNLFNHPIVSARSGGQYKLTFPTSGTYAGKGLLTPDGAYGSITATQSTPDGTTARRMQAAVRMTW